jgi:transcriptional regulator with XRE-family HTH domain
VRSTRLTHLILASLITLLGASSAWAAPRSIALLPLEDRVGLTATERGRLQAALRSAARALGAQQFRLLSPANVARAPQSKPCTRVCALVAGKALNADYIMVGSVDRAPEGRAAIISLYHVRSNGHLGTRRAAANPLKLPDVLGVAASRLFDQLRVGGARFTPKPAPVKVVVQRRPPVPALPVRRPPVPRRPVARPPARTPGVAAARRAPVPAARPPSPATRRDPGLFEVWAAAKSDLLVGQAGIFDTYSSPFGPGVELGFEAVGIDVWGEAMFMGSDEYYFSVDLGLDFEFGSDVSLLVGAYTGPMFLLFAERPVESFALTDTQRQLLELSGVSRATITALENGYNEAATQEAALNRSAVGWNLLRLRAALDFWVAPVLAIGVHATGSYHYLLTGEDVGADIKYTAIQDVRKDQGLTDEQAELLREAVGAKKVEVDNLGGYNFTGGVYLKLSL